MFVDEAHWYELELCKKFGMLISSGEADEYHSHDFNYEVYGWALELVNQLTGNETELELEMKLDDFLVDKLREMKW